MMGEVVPLNRDVTPSERRYRHAVPKEHRISMDTRVHWLWNQRFGTVQMVYLNSTDILDRTAAMLILQAIMAKDLRSIQQLFNRLEGGPKVDQAVQDDEAMRI